MSTSRTYYTVLAIMLVMWALAYGVYPPQSALRASGGGEYVSGTYGIALTYPASYRLTEEDVGPPEPPHHRIELIPSDSSGRASPTADIDIDIVENEGRYDTAADFYPALDRFMRGSGYSSRYVPAIVVRRGYVYIYSTSWLDAATSTRQTLEDIIHSARYSE